MATPFPPLRRGGREGWDASPGDRPDDGLDGIPGSVGATSSRGGSGRPGHPVVPGPPPLAPPCEGGEIGLSRSGIASAFDDPARRIRDAPRIWAARKVHLGMSTTFLSSAG